MDSIQEALVTFFCLLPLGVGSIVVLYRRGCLRADAMASGPDRALAGLRVGDVFVGLGLMFLGGGVYQAMVSAMGLPPPATQAAGTPTAMEQAQQALLAQAVVQLPAVLYVLGRVGLAGGWAGLKRVGVLSGRLGRDLRLALAGLLVTLPLVLGVLSLATLLGLMFGQEAPAVGHELLQAMRKSTSPAGTALLIVSAVGVAPVVEEVLYRGLLQTVLLRTIGPQHRWRVVLLAAMVFTAMHQVPWQALPGLLVLGVAVGWLYEKSGSLWPSIGVHAGFNALNVAAVLLMPGLG
ncbi:MAG TPA: CPBP family intramembrane glutamic endopeptidase [Phycisphaeraceae bacterium]